MLLSKIYGIFFSAVKVVSSKPSVGPLPRITISFFLLSIGTDELISAPNIITILPNSLLSVNEKLASNPVLYPEYLIYRNQHF